MGIFKTEKQIDRYRRLSNIVFICLVIFCFSLSIAKANNAQGGEDINAKFARIDMRRAKLADIIRVFGEPEKYFHGKETFTKDKLPDIYMAEFKGNWGVYMKGNKIDEVRFHSPGYLFRGKVQVGSPLEEAVKAMGRPREVVVGGKNRWKDGILYRDIDGVKGYCYYERSVRGVRMFFSDYRVSGLYLSAKGFRYKSRKSSSAKSKGKEDNQNLDGLEFRIVVEPSISSFYGVHLELGQEKHYREDLKNNGPHAGWQRADEYIWIEAMPGFENQVLIVEQYDGKKYLLVCNQKKMKMTADGSWGLNKVYPSKDNLNRPAVKFEFDSNGKQLFNNLTGDNLHKRLAVIVDGKVYSLLNIQSAAKGEGIIIGKFSETEINELVKKLSTSMLIKPQENKTKGKVVDGTNG